MPFWKKTDKGGKKKPPKPAVPRTAQQSIPMQRMFEDGTCRVKPNYYTRTIQYQDINYQLAQQEDKTAIFEEWCSFLNFFDSSIKFELSFVNMATDSTEFEKSIRIPYQKDGFDDVRAEYSQMLRQQLAKGNNGLTKTKFITFGVEGESMRQVKARLDHIQNDLLNNCHRLGVPAKPLNGAERLKLMHDMFNMDGASKFHFDWKDLVKSGLSVKDAIAPTAFAFKNSRTFQMGGIYCAASFLSITASDISDQLLKDFLDMDSSQIVTMHIQSVDQNRAIKTVKRTITELDRSKIEEQKKAIRAGYDIDIIPSDLATYGRDAKALLKELQSQNELAMRFTKGKYAFIVATHTDREHIHNHIIYNSTALDSTRKFRDFLLSGLAVQRLSDLICLEHQLSVIEKKPYRERQKRTLYPPKESNRDHLCSVLDNILAEKPKGYEDFLQKLEQQGYEVKRGKYTSVKGKRQKRFIRFRTLGTGYSEEELKAVIAGEAEHRPHQKQPPKEKPFNLLVDVQAKLAEGKNIGYARWAKKYNLKEMSKTLIFLQEKKIGSIEEMQERVDAATARYHELGDSIKAAETRMTEIAVLRTHIVNYAKTRPVYDAYRKAGYSKRFLENHRAEITLHKAAKTAFDEAKLKKLPKVKELDAEYSKLLTEKKAAYPDYRKAKDEMQELLRAQRNVELFFAEEKNTTEKTQSR